MCNKHGSIHPYILQKRIQKHIYFILHQGKGIKLPKDQWVLPSSLIPPCFLWMFQNNSYNYNLNQTALIWRNWHVLSNLEEIKAPWNRCSSTSEQWWIGKFSSRRSYYESPKLCKFMHMNYRSKVPLEGTRANILHFLEAIYQIRWCLVIPMTMDLFNKHMNLKERICTPLS